jgi:tRNA uridine 5-carbamoylmethylation protein Kti12
MLMVILVCGLPGAGKSSFLREFVHKSTITTTITNTTTTAHSTDKERQSLRTLVQHPPEKEEDATITTSTTNMEIIEYDALVDQEILRRSSSNSASDEADSTETNVQTILQAWKTSRRRAESQLVERLTILAQQQQQQQQTQSPTTILFLDDNFYLRSMRKQIYRIVSQIQPPPPASSTNTTQEETIMKIYFGIVWYDTPLEICIERNQNRSTRNIPEHVIRSMHQRFEIPGSTSTKNYPTIPYWETSVVRLDGSLPDISHNIPVLQSFLQQLVTTTTPVTLQQRDHNKIRDEPEHAQTAASVSQQQQADLLWRKCVTETVRIRRELAKAANEQRKACLQQLHHIHGDMNRKFLLELFLTPIQNNTDHHVEWLTESEKDILQKNLLLDKE